jgi:glycosyltransferase involved in cell wall biosynthesis
VEGWHTSSTPEVCLLCEYPTLNGGERSMLSTFAGMRSAGFSPVVLCPPEGDLAEAVQQAGAEVVPFDCRNDDGERLSQSRLREILAETLQKHRPRILHANSLSMGRLSGPVASELHLPSISHLRDIVGLSPKAIEDVNRHTRLLAVSHAVRNHHAAQGVVAEKTYVIYNGVDLDRFRPREPTGFLHREFGLPSNAILAGSIGQIGLRKGQDVLLHGAQKIAGAMPNLHFVVVGERYSTKQESRDFEASLHAIAEAVMPGRVHFLGVRNDVDRLLNEFALLVHTARQEPLGRVLLEAAAAGVAIIATDVGGAREIFPAERNAAWLFPADDIDALAAAIQTLANDPSARQALGVAARRRAEETFSVASAAEGLTKHYLAVL